MLDALAATADTPGPDQVAAELRRLGASQVSIRLTPLFRTDGHAAISWRQDGRQRTAEGSTLGVAFRRARRAPGRPIWGRGHAMTTRKARIEIAADTRHLRGAPTVDLSEHVPLRLGTWDLVHEARPAPMNEYRNMHWRQAAEHTREWRQAFGWLARQARVPHLERAAITVAQTCRPGTPLPDIGACYPAAKAGIDGLVDAGVIPDDTGDHLMVLLFTPPTASDVDRLIIAVDPWEAG